MNHQVLIVTPETGWFKYYEILLRPFGLKLQHAKNFAEASSAVTTNTVALVITENDLPGQDGYQLLHWLSLNRPLIPVILFCETKSTAAVSLTRFFLTKEDLERDLPEAVKQALKLS